MNNQSNDPAELQRTDENAQVEVAPPPRNALARPQLTAGAQIAAIIPRSFEDVQRIANMAVRSGLAQRDVNSLERCSYVIMFGLEIGMKPLASLQRIAIIGGRPCVWGEAVPAIAIDTGELIGIKEWNEGAGDDLTYYCKVARKLRNGSVIEKTTKFSIAQAKKANLWDERKQITRRNRATGENYTVDNDSAWYRFPERMLEMRARVAIRDVFADAMCGLYIAEEMANRDTPSDMRDVTPTYERIANPLGGNGEVPDKVVGRDMVQNAAGDAAGASNGESDGGQPSDEKTNQRPNGERGAASRRRTRPAEGTAAEGHRGPSPSETASAGDGAPAVPLRPSDPSAITLAQPWIKRTGAEYVVYVQLWASLMTDNDKARARWNAERNIRNGLQAPLSAGQLDLCQQALGTVAKAAII